MAEKFVIKRNWDDVIIRVAIDDKEVRIETSIDAFQRKLEDYLIESLPRLTWHFRRSAINEKIRKSFKDAFFKITREMKEETIKVVEQPIVSKPVVEKTPKIEEEVIGLQNDKINDFKKLPLFTQYSIIAHSEDISFLQLIIDDITFNSDLKKRAQNRIIRIKNGKYNYS